jgi:ABC-2 type transport system permease protein
VRSIVRKELREYRHNLPILAAVAIFPLIFLVQPLVVVFVVPSSAAGTLAREHVLLYLLGIPVLTPAVLAAYAVAGERQQGSLEPVLTTPIRAEELLLGKALAALIPSVAVAYAVYAIFLAVVEILARPSVASGLLRPPDIGAQVLFTPLLAGLSIWIAIGISTRTSDFRVAQQFSLLGCLPIVLVTSLVAFNVIQPTLGLAVGAGAFLIAADNLGWRVVSPMFNRERLITGTR